MSILTSVKKINYLNNSSPCNINKKSLYTRRRNNIRRYLLKSIQKSEPGQPQRNYATAWISQRISFYISFHNGDEGE